MPTPVEVLITLGRLNLVAAAAILAVLALRGPVRRWFGAGAAYALWLAVPIAVAGALLPAPLRPAPASPPPPVAARAIQPAPASMVRAAPAARSIDVGRLLFLAWLVGAGTAAGACAWRHERFLALVRKSLVGPAVVGLWRPRIILPGDFESRFAPEEREMILAHEAVHLSRQDSRINALVVTVQCLSWFNPLVHVAAHFVRVDQELACDAAVLDARPAARRAYAEALVKTQLAATPLLAGCYWPARSEHPLNRRIAMLKRETPPAVRRRLGLGLIASVSLAGAYGAWAGQPPRIAEPTALPQSTPSASIMPAPSPVSAVFPETKPPLVDDTRAARRFAALAPEIEAWVAAAPDTAPAAEAIQPPKRPVDHGLRNEVARRKQTLDLWARLAERDYEETRARHEVGAVTRTDLARAELKRTQIQSIGQQADLAIRYYNGVSEEYQVGLRSEEDLDAAKRELSRIQGTIESLTDPYR